MLNDLFSLNRNFAKIYYVNFDISVIPRVAAGCKLVAPGATPQTVL